MPKKIKIKCFDVILYLSEATAGCLELLYYILKRMSAWTF